MSDKQGKTPAKPVSRETAADTMEIIAAFMGTRNKWGYEIGEDVAEIIFEAGYPHPANPDNRAHYEARARTLGMDFEEAEEDGE